MTKAGTGRRAVGATALFAAMAGFGATAQGAVVFDFNTFAGACGTTLTCVGNTAVAGSALRVTPATFFQAGAGYGTTAITLGASATFSTSFQFQITSAGGIDPADGLTFVLAAANAGLGSAGGGIGYGGVPNSVAIEFDTFNNGGGDGNSSNHVGVDVNGSLNSNPLVNPYGVVTCDFSGGTIHTRAGCMSNGNVWTATITYDGALLDVIVQDGAAAPFTILSDHAIDIAAVLGTNTAFVGFTSGTGSGFANHDILRWRLDNDAVLEPPQPGVPEPGTLALLALGFLGAAVARRRSRPG
jgi:hypothetical protein